MKSIKNKSKVILNYLKLLYLFYFPLSHYYTIIIVILQIYSSPFLKLQIFKIIVQLCIVFQTYVIM